MKGVPREPVCVNPRETVISSDDAQRVGIGIVCQSEFATVEFLVELLLLCESFELRNGIGPVRFVRPDFQDSRFQWEAVIGRLGGKHQIRTGKVAAVRRC